VLGVCFSDGVVIAADSLASYGSMALFRSCERILKVNEQTVAGCGGDYSDFQYFSKLIEQKQIDEEANRDGFNISPKALHSWLTRVQYNRRSKLDPLWTTWVVGGMENGRPYLGFVDKLGTSYEDSYIATGFGFYFALPLMLKRLEEKPILTKEEAIDLIKECLKVLWYRDCKALNSYHLAVVDTQGATIEGPFRLEANWYPIHIVHN
jgi:proteasome subunit beta type-4 (fragment)